MIAPEVIQAIEIAWLKAMRRDRARVRPRQLVQELQRKGDLSRWMRFT